MFKIDRGNTEGSTERKSVGMGYFHTLGVPIIDGRDFNAADFAQHRKVALINQEFARRYFGDENPVGHRITFQYGNRAVPDKEIVGVYKDYQSNSFRKHVAPMAITPYVNDRNLQPVTVFVRSRRTATDIKLEVRGVLSRVDPRIAFSDFEKLDDRLLGSIKTERTLALLSAWFAAAAIVISGIGLFGLARASVANRRVEIGVRLALGAPSVAICRLVLDEMMAVTAIGSIIGICGAAWAGRLVTAQLYGVTPANTWIYLVAVIASFVLCAVASYWPIKNALNIAPALTLRNRVD
jgi:ABC-type antimicrobial peptide transport system permease subunit